MGIEREVGVNEIKYAYSTRCPNQPSPYIVVNTGYISRILLIKPTKLCKEVIYRFLCKGKNITLARKMIRKWSYFSTLVALSQYQFYFINLSNRCKECF